MHTVSMAIFQIHQNQSIACMIPTLYWSSHLYTIQKISNAHIGLSVGRIGCMGS